MHIEVLSVAQWVKNLIAWSSRRGAAETNPTMNHEVAGLIPGLSLWVKDLALLWLTATAPIRPLAWGLPICCDCGKKKKKKKKKSVRLLPLSAVSCGFTVSLLEPCYGDRVWGRGNILEFYD